jgi:hypothetical protein
MPLTEHAYCAQAANDHDNASKAFAWIGTSLQEAIMIGYVAFFITLCTLSFVASILVAIVNTVYVCYARDLENHCVTRADVHSVIKELPSASGAVVLQPDNAIQYGALEEGELTALPAAVEPSGGATVAPHTAEIAREFAVDASLDVALLDNKPPSMWALAMLIPVRRVVRG